MIPERSAFGNDLQVDARNTEVFLTSSATVTTYAVKVYEQVVRIVLTSGNAMACILPSVAEAKGKIYSFRVITDGGSSATVDDKGDDAQFSIITLADDEDGVVLYSDGRNWWTIASNGI